MLHQYLGLMSDVPHLAAEFSIDLITGVVAVVAGWVFGKRRGHLEADLEHGITHEAPDTGEGFRAYPPGTIRPAPVDDYYRPLSGYLHATPPFWEREEAR